MIKTYKNFKRKEEIFCGLSLIPSLQIALSSTLFFSIAVGLKLNPSSPLFLLLAVSLMIFTAFIIKAARGEEVRGFYSSILLFPFKDHIWSSQPNNYYPNIESLKQSPQIYKDYIQNKDGDLLSIIKLENVISRNILSNAKQKELLKTWGISLSQLNKISSLSSSQEDSFSNNLLQVFIEINKYQVNEHLNSRQIDQLDLEWLSNEFDIRQFIPDLSFYIILKHQITPNKVNKWIKRLRKILGRTNPNYNQENELELLNNKTQVLIESLQQINITATILSEKDLERFTAKWSENGKSFIYDFNKYLQHNLTLDTNSNQIISSTNSYFTKTYRIKTNPNNGDLNFWLEEILVKLNLEGFISIYIEPRDAIKDRRKIEYKLSWTKNIYLIEEYKNLVSYLLKHPQSFDLSILITLKSNKLLNLQNAETKIRHLIKDAQLASLNRQQIENWISSLPFGNNLVKPEDKLFASLDFIEASFPLLEKELGSPNGYLFGVNLENQKPVFINEYDSSIFHNRGINYIGDSGSGKTVAAKLAVKRRFEEQNHFYIIDSTDDGWKFFVEYLGGEIVYLDKALPNGSIFNPLAIPPTASKELIQQQIQEIIKIFSFIEDRKLSTNDKFFLQEHLNKIYSKNQNLCLSDFYNYLCKESSIEAISWAQKIAPFCYSAKGIYSFLADSTKESFNSKSKLILFTFSKPNHDDEFLGLGIYLINLFIIKKIFLEKQSKSTLIIDEAWKIFTNNNSSSKNLLTYFARAGRGLDLGLWTISQKPGDLPREIHSSASLSLCFQLKESKDREEIVNLSNLSELEKELLTHPEMSRSGTCLIKNTKNSGISRIKLDPIESILCSSTRDLVNQRNKLFDFYCNEITHRKLELTESEIRKLAAQNTINTIINHGSFS